MTCVIPRPSGYPFENGYPGGRETRLRYEPGSVVVVTLGDVE